MIFIETPTFLPDREQYLPDDTFAALQQMLADDPDAGDLIPGGHGLRKIRVALRGRGKRGGGAGDLLLASGRIADSAGRSLREVM